jgi:hypothetical protein
MSDYSYTWPEIAAMLRGEAHGSTVTIGKQAIAAPESCGFRRTVGLSNAQSQGKTEDWRIRLKGGGCLHVQAVDENWVAHCDVTDPTESLFGHALDDLPGLTVAGAAVVGLVLGGGLVALIAGGVAALLAFGRASLRQQDEFHAFLCAPAATYEAEESKPVSPEAPVSAPTPETPAVKGLLTEGIVAEVVDIDEARRARAAIPADKAG